MVWTEEIKQKDVGRLERKAGNYSLMFGLGIVCLGVDVENKFNFYLLYNSAVNC